MSAPRSNAILPFAPGKAACAGVANASEARIVMHMALRRAAKPSLRVSGRYEATASSRAEQCESESWADNLRERKVRAAALTRRPQLIDLLEVPDQHGWQADIGGRRGLGDVPECASLRRCLVGGQRRL